MNATNDGSECLTHSTVLLCSVFGQSMDDSRIWLSSLFKVEIFSKGILKII